MGKVMSCLALCVQDELMVSRLTIYDQDIHDGVAEEDASSVF